LKFSLRSSLPEQNAIINFQTKKQKTPQVMGGFKRTTVCDKGPCCWSVRKCLSVSGTVITVSILCPNEMSKKETLSAHARLIKSLSRELYINFGGIHGAQWQERKLNRREMTRLSRGGTKETNTHTAAPRPLTKLLMKITRDCNARPVFLPRYALETQPEREEIE